MPQSETRYWAGIEGQEYIKEESDLPPGLSVVVPVYNSESSLRPLVERLASTLRELNTDHELVLVDDGSHDESWSVIEELAHDFPWIVGIRLMRNYGQHNALLCGIRAARYDVIVTMDDDLQHPPEEIPKLLATLDHAFDVVYGTPKQQQHGLLRDTASVITKLALHSTTGSVHARQVSAFRAFSTSLRDAFSAYQGSFVSIDVLLTWGTTRFASVPVEHEPRATGNSGYTFRKLVTHALNMMTGFSVLPLQLASVIGLFFTAFGIGVLVYVLSVYLFVGSSVEGFYFLASVIAIFSGAQLFALGIFGEYLARMHHRIMSKPPYAVAVTKSTTTD